MESYTSIVGAETDDVRIPCLEIWSQSYDRELQRQRCNNSQHHKQPSAF
jgi:hypothetical protein